MSQPGWPRRPAKRYGCAPGWPCGWTRHTRNRRRGKPRYPGRPAAGRTAPAAGTIAPICRRRPAVWWR